MALAVARYLRTGDGSRLIHQTPFCPARFTPRLPYRTLAPMSDQIPSLQYHAMREQVEGILAEGKAHTRQAAAWEKVEIHWHIGDALQTHFHRHPRAECLVRPTDCP